MIRRAALTLLIASCAATAASADPVRPRDYRYEQHCLFWLFCPVVDKPRVRPVERVDIRPHSEQTLGRTIVMGLAF